MAHAELDYGVLHYSKETELHLRKQEVTERGFIQGNRVIKCGPKNVQDSETVEHGRSTRL